MAPMEACSRWLIEYELGSPIPVVQRVGAYPSLQLTLIYDSAGRLIELRHIVETDTGQDAVAAVHESTRLLNCLIQVLEFGYSLPVSLKPLRVTSIPMSMTTSARSLGIRSVSLGAAIATTATLPSEATLQQTGSGSAAVLYMFNAARRASADEEALRLYYFILEFLNTSASKRTWNQADKRVWFARDFVSHGEALSRNQDAIAFVEHGTGKPIARFDPQDRDHRRFVAEERRLATAYLECRIAALL